MSEVGISEAAWLWHDAEITNPEWSGYYLCWTSGSRGGERPIVAWYNANRGWETKRPVAHWMKIISPLVAVSAGQNP